MKRTNFLKRTLLLFIILSLCSANILLAQVAYPAELNVPENTTATMNVNTDSQEEFNNLLLGYNIEHFTKNQEKDLIRLVKPITIRFPHGLWANWYDWEKDITRLYGNVPYGVAPYPGREPDFYSTILTKQASGAKVGIVGLTQLNNEKKASSGKGYDMMWTFNMSADAEVATVGQAPQTVARYNDLISRGFEVKAIELGNENFYVGQRSSLIVTPEAYVARAKAIADTLRQLDPNIQLSVPLLKEKRDETWNPTLCADDSYFDAVTVHNYESSFYGCLTARNEYQKCVNYARQHAPNKPVWLTEWGLKADGTQCAATALGMTDMMLYMSENQDIYHRANWFSYNRALDPMIQWLGSHPNYDPIRKTTTGAAYEVVRSVLENTSIVENNMNVNKLGSTSVNAVNATIVKKENGDAVILAVNLSNQAILFTLNIDGSNYKGDFVHEAIDYAHVGESNFLLFDESPLSLIKEGKGNLTLPPLSINVISNIQLKTLSVIPGKIEAEAYTNMSGIDTTGNLASDFNPGDWVEYELAESLPGNYEVSYSVAAASLPVYFELLIDGNGLSTLNSETTGSFDTYKTITDTILLKTAPKLIRIQALGMGWNLDWFEFIRIDAPPVLSFNEPGGDTATLVFGYDALIVDVNASDEAGTIANVQLFVDDTLISTDVDAPYQWGNVDQTELLGLAPGEHIFKATASDNVGLTAEASFILNVIDTCAIDSDGDGLYDCEDACPYDPSHLCGYVAKIPGKIEVEAFTTMDGVKVDASGKFLTYIRSWDWMEYQLAQSSAGYYEVRYKVAATSVPMYFELLVDGNVISTVNSEPTGSFGTYKIIKDTVLLTAAPQTIGIQSLSNSWNFDWFEFVKLETTPTGLTTVNQSIETFNVMPNPMVRDVTIEFVLENESNITLSVYNINGNLVDALYKGNRPGLHRLSWNGTGANNNLLSNGIYFLRLTSKNEVYGKKICIMR